MNLSGFFSVPIDNDFDFNRDGFVNATDVGISRLNLSGFFPIVLLDLSAGKTGLSDSNGPSDFVASNDRLVWLGDHVPGFSDFRSTKFASSGWSGDDLKRDSDRLDLTGAVASDRSAAAISEFGITDATFKVESAKRATIHFEFRSSAAENLLSQKTVLEEF